MRVYYRKTGARGGEGNGTRTRTRSVADFEKLLSDQARIGAEFDEKLTYYKVHEH